MDRLVSIPMRIGAWRVDPVLGQISQGQEVLKVEARTMRLLLCLAQRAGEIVSVEELLDQVWTGVIVTPDSVYQSIASLRRLLGDDSKQPRYIAIVPRLGYRMIADVTPYTDTPLAQLPRGTSRRFRPAIFGGAFLVFGILCMAVWFYGHAVSGPQSAIAVLPFLDLTTQEMNEEFFADGLTEELIGDLSKNPALRVPSPTAIFYFKGKQLPIADIARQLGVSFMIDGSVRKADNMYRVAIRLIRAGDGYVIWTESYDRPLGDLLQVQKDLATEVTKNITGLL